MSVENSMKPCDDGEGSSVTASQSGFPMPDGRNTISKHGTTGDGKLYNRDHVRTSQRETQGFQLIGVFRECCGFVWS